jgi:uncharacterized iron-regulated membrane protein
LLIIAITGIVLAWKKNSNGYLQAKVLAGSNLQPSSWQSIAALSKSANSYLHIHFPSLDTTIDRVDIRPADAIAKIIYKKHYTALHVDLATVSIIQTEVRRADFIEKLHDGSIVDDWTNLHVAKLIYSSFTGLALLLLVVSGFYLWLNPKRVRKIKQVSLVSNQPSVKDNPVV